jgi:hypothetical protein
MKRLTVLLATLSLLGTAAVFWQRQAVSDLQTRGANPGFQQREATADSNQLSALESEAATLRNETKDLARLRNEVGQLRAKQNELALARAEHDRLLDAKRTGASLPREAPPGFIGREQLHNAGYETPEDTIQTFFWAMREGDYETVMQSLVPENAARISTEKLPPEKRAQVAEGFKHEIGEGMMQKFNDFSIVRREEVSDDTVVLYVRSSVATNTMPHRLKRVGQEWKLVDL